jgi:hypothetical protein
MPEVSSIHSYFSENMLTIVTLKFEATENLHNFSDEVERVEN